MFFFFPPFRLKKTQVYFSFFINIHTVELKTSISYHLMHSSIRCKRPVKALKGKYLSLEYNYVLTSSILVIFLLRTRKQRFLRHKHWHNLRISTEIFPIIQPVPNLKTSDFVTSYKIRDFNSNNNISMFSNINMNIYLVFCFQITRYKFMFIFENNVENEISDFITSCRSIT